MYKTKIVVDGFGNEIEHIFIDASQGGTITFPNIEANTGSFLQLPAVSYCKTLIRVQYGRE